MNDIGITYIGPETGLSKSELNSLNTILVQEKQDFDNRVGNIKRETSFTSEEDFFKPSGPISNVRAKRYRIRNRKYTTLHFILDTSVFEDTEGDVFLGILDEMGMNINAIGYVLQDDYPVQLLHGKFGFVSRANGTIEIIYNTSHDVASRYTCIVSYWDEVLDDTNNDTTKQEYN